MSDQKVDSKKVAPKKADPTKTENKEKKPISPAEEKPPKTDNKKAAPSSDKKDKVSDKTQKEDKTNEKKEINKDKKEESSNKEKKEENKEKKDDNKIVTRKESKSVDEKNKNKDNNNNNKKKNKEEQEQEQQQQEEEEEEKEKEVVSPKIEETKNDDKNIEEMENKKIPIFNVGDEVVLTKDRMGIIRFKGRVPEMGIGIYYGVELTDGSVGHNDGLVKGVRYFQTESQRAMFVGHEKIRRKMTARDHKRIDSFHAVSKSSKEDVDGPKTPKQANSSNQDDEKESVLSPSEQERQRQESLAQRDEQHEGKDLVHADGLEAAKKNENIIQFILRQNNKYRDVLLDTYANPQTHITIVHAFGSLQEMEGDLQLQGWNELIKRWQKFL